MVKNAVANVNAGGNEKLDSPNNGLTLNYAISFNPFVINF